MSWGKSYVRQQGLMPELENMKKLEAATKRVYNQMADRYSASQTYRSDFEDLRTPEVVSATYTSAASPALQPKVDISSSSSSSSASNITPPSATPGTQGVPDNFVLDELSKVGDVQFPKQQETAQTLLAPVLLMGDKQTTRDQLLPDGSTAKIKTINGIWTANPDIPVEFSPGKIHFGFKRFDFASQAEVDDPQAYDASPALLVLLMADNKTLAKYASDDSFKQKVKANGSRIAREYIDIVNRSAQKVTRPNVGTVASSSSQAPITERLRWLQERVFEPALKTWWAPYNLYNHGNSKKPMSVLDLYGQDRSEPDMRQLAVQMGHGNFAVRNVRKRNVSKKRREKKKPTRKDDLRRATLLLATQKAGNDGKRIKTELAQIATRLGVH